MRGDLSETSAADACRGLGGDGATGTLAIGGLDGPGHIVFEQGRIVHANAPTATARLGDRLVGAGFLTEAELREVLDAQRSGESRGRLGALLVERSLVTSDAIRLFVQEQALEALFEVLRWRFGSFAFQPGRAEDRGGVRVAMPVDDVLLVVGRRHEEWHELSRTIPDLAAVPTFSSNPNTVSASLEPDEFAVLASVDGERDVRELAADLGYNELELARIVYGLTLLGVVDIRLPEDEIGAALDAALHPPSQPTATDPADGSETDDGIDPARAGGAAPGIEPTEDPDGSPLARVFHLPTSRQPTADDPAPDDHAQPSDQPTDADADTDADTDTDATADQATADRPRADPSTDADQHRPADEPSVQAQRAASMADLADTSTSSFPDILRELREHSSGTGRRRDTAPTGATGEPAAAATERDRTSPADQPSSGAEPSQDRSGDTPADARPTRRGGSTPGSGSDDQPQQGSDPADEQDGAETPDSRADNDVSEFLRELSRLAGDDEPTTPRPPRPPDRSGRSGTSSSGTSGSTGDDDPKRRRRGLFGRG